MAILISQMKQFWRCLRPTKWGFGAKKQNGKDGQQNTLHYCSICEVLNQICPRPNWYRNLLVNSYLYPKLCHPWQINALRKTFLKRVGSKTTLNFVISLPFHKFLFWIWLSGASAQLFNTVLKIRYSQRCCYLFKQRLSKILNFEIRC